jgi:phosphatidylserine decarboxylase
MNQRYPHPIIAREGWPFLCIALVLLILAVCFLPYVLIAIFGLAFIFILQFFRDPPRRIPQEIGVLTSPADGRIVTIAHVINPYTQKECLKISVFMNVFNVHSNRIPCDGTIKSVTYMPGSFLNAALDKASLENERNAVIMNTSDGQHEVTFVQIAGLVARRILCYIKPQQIVARGERYGFIRFGSRVDVYCPKEAMSCVSIGERVRATETVLARLPS